MSHPIFDTKTKHQTKKHHAIINESLPNIEWVTNTSKPRVITIHFTPPLNINKKQGQRHKNKHLQIIAPQIHFNLRRLIIRAFKAPVLLETRDLWTEDAACWLGWSLRWSTGKRLQTPGILQLKHYEEYDDVWYTIMHRSSTLYTRIDCVVLLASTSLSNYCYCDCHC